MIPLQCKKCKRILGFTNKGYRSGGWIGVAYNVKKYERHMNKCFPNVPLVWSTFGRRCKEHFLK